MRIFFANAHACTLMVFIFRYKFTAEYFRSRQKNDSAAASDISASDRTGVDSATLAQSDRSPQFLVKR